MSRTLSMNCGSEDSFQVCSRCGLSPNARQIREIAVWLVPVARAIDRVNQWVSRRRLLQGLNDHLLDLGVGDRAGPARAAAARPSTG
jgi:hypothetical protein